MPEEFRPSFSRARPLTCALLAGCVVVFCGGAGFVEAQTYHALSGRIVKSDGKPLAGATVFVTADASLQKTTDAQGQFHFSEAEMERLLKKAAADKPKSGVDMVAVAEGFGLNWITIRKYATNPSQEDLDPEAARNITLRLVKDVPVRGRFVDSEGVPIPNVTIELGQVIVLPKNDLTLWLKRWETNRRDGWTRLASRFAERKYRPIRRRFSALAGRALPVSNEPGISATIATDADGHFAIHGLGRDRTAWFTARHPDFVTRVFFVATRETFELNPANPKLPPLHPTTFTQVLEPAKPIKGFVQEYGTCKPLGGATVYMSEHPSTNSNVATTMTGEDGIFLVRGLEVAEYYRCVVISGKGQPHLRREYMIAGTPGLNPLDVGIKLFRGTVMKGIVRNKRTGEPLFRASLTYLPIPGNSNLSVLRESGDGVWDERFETGLDGSFNIAIPPGPGLIGVRVSFDGADDRFHSCSNKDFPFPLEEEDGEYYFKSANGRVVRPEQFLAVVKVDPTNDDGTRKLDIRLNPK